MNVAPGAGYESTLQGGPGTYFPDVPAGTYGFRLTDGQGNVITARATTGIVREGVGIWTATRTAPTTAGTYTRIWDNGAAAEVVDSDPLIVSYMVPAPPGTPGEIALERLRIMTDAGTDPALSEDELVLLLDTARRADTLGRAPSDDEWEPTWALGVAAAQGWEWKAGRAATRFDFRADDQTFNRSQTRKGCMEMAALYRRRPLASVALHRPEVIEATRYADVPDGQRALLPGAQGPVHLGPGFLAAGALPGAAERGDNAA